MMSFRRSCFRRYFRRTTIPVWPEETDLYQEKPNAKQLSYIEDCVRGVYVKKQEIDQIIETYAVGWKVSRISKVSLAVLAAVDL